MSTVRTLWVAALFVVVGISCSEKQKEAARLEAAMRSGDTVVNPSSVDTASMTQPGQFDSAVAQISAQISSGDAQGKADSSSNNATSQEMHAETTKQMSNLAGDSQMSATPTESKEQVMDAGAIPQEEMPKKDDVPVKIAPPVVTQATPSDESPTGTGFVVQVVSTPDEAEATMLVTKFAKGGYRAFKTMAVVEGTTYYRVRVGKYESVSEAESALSELHEKYKVNGFVTSVK